MLASHRVRNGDILEMRQWDEENVRYFALGALRPSNLVLASIEGLHDDLVDLRWRQLLRRLVIDVLLIYFVDLLLLLLSVEAASEDVTECVFVGEKIPEAANVRLLVWRDRLRARILVVVRLAFFAAVILDLDLGDVLADDRFILLAIVRLAVDLLLIFQVLDVHQWQHLVDALAALLRPLDLQVVLVSLQLDDDHADCFLPHLARDQLLVSLVRILLLSAFNRI